ncbi:ABC transporter permease [Peribacillus simplex]|uniref:ABC transporter permease n=1 Tax=Peribacillus simplex TaxID=1478 RepID=UPI003D2B8A0E
MLNMWLVSWRNLTKNRRRFIFTLIAVILGIILTTSMLVANNTVKDTFEYYEKIYAGDADYWVLSNDFSFSEDEVDWIKEKGHVANTLSVLDKQTTVKIDSLDAVNETSVRVTGVSDIESDLLELPLIKGDLDQGGLIIPENAAKLWGKDIGDTVEFKGLGTIKISGIVGFTSWLASPNSWDEAEGKHFRVMMDLETLQKWTGLENQISYMRFQHEDRYSDNWLSKYQEKFEGTTLYVQPVVIDNLRNNDINGLNSVFYLVSVLALFISGFIIFNMIFSSVIERRKEFSIMKSLGYTNFNVFKLVFIEVLILAILGTLIALPVGVLFADLFVDMLLGIFQDTMVYELNWKNATIISGIIGLAFPIIVSMIPMYIACKTPIIKSMSNSVQTINTRKNLIRYVLGFAFLVMSFIDHYVAYVFLLLGTVLIFPLIIKIIAKLLSPLMEKMLSYPGRLAVNNIRININRNANTSAMLALSISVVVFLGSALEAIPTGFEKEIKSTFGGDLQVQFEVPINEEDINLIEEYENVDSVAWYKETMVTWETKSKDKREFYLMSSPSDEEKGFHLYEEQKSKLVPGSILLGERAFDEWGGEINDRISLNTPNGPTTLQVIGKVKTSQDGGYVGFVDIDDFSEEFNWPNVFTLMVKANSEHDVVKIRDQLNNDFNTSISSITLIQDQVESSQASFDGMNKIMQFLLILVIALSSIGISNTLLMNTMERIGEIGTIRAIGFTTSQVRKMILGEGLVVGFTGIITGVLLGLSVIYLNSVSEAATTYMPFVIPWGNILLAIISGLILSLLASIIPSYFAIRINIQQALKEN